MFHFRLRKSIISQFMETVCKTIYNTLAPEYIEMPIVKKNEKT